MVAEVPGDRNVVLPVDAADPGHDAIPVGPSLTEMLIRNDCESLDPDRVRAAPQQYVTRGSLAAGTGVMFFLRRATTLGRCETHRPRSATIMSGPTVLLPTVSDQIRQPYDFEFEPEIRDRLESLGDSDFGRVDDL